MNFYYFIEPHPSGGDAIVIISEERAIKLAKERAEASNKKIPEKVLLDFFLVNHYAEKLSRKQQKAAASFIKL